MKDRVFGHWTTTSFLGSPDRLKGLQVRRRKGKGKGKGKRGFKGTGRAFLGEEQAQDPECWSEEDCAWWFKGKSGKKGFSKGYEGFQQSCFGTYQPEKKVQAMIATRTMAEARTKKERARKVLILNLDFQPRKHPEKKDMAMLQLLGGLARELKLHGWHQSL